MRLKHTEVPDAEIAPTRRTTAPYIGQVNGPSQIKVDITIPAGTLVHGFPDGSGARHWYVKHPGRLVPAIEFMQLHDAEHYGLEVPPNLTEPL